MIDPGGETPLALSLAEPRDFLTPKNPKKPPKAAGRKTGPSARPGPDPGAGSGGGPGASPAAGPAGGPGCGPGCGGPERRGFFKRLVNFFYPRVPEHGSDLSQEQTGELRKGCLLGVQFAGKKVYVLEQLAAIDDGERPRFNLRALVFGIFWLAFYVKDRALSVLTTLIIIDILFLLIFRQDAQVLSWFIWIYAWIFSGLIANRWLYHTVTKEINETLTQCQGNIERSQKILSKNYYKRFFYLFICISLVCIESGLFNMFMYYLPICNSKIYIPTVIDTAYDGISKNLNRSKEDLNKNTILRFSDFNTLENGFQICKCSLNFTIFERNSNNMYGDIIYTVDTSQGKLPEYVVTVSYQNVRK
ncbi:MAG: hypothetical protein LBE80_02205 [Deltaproteobacteria bacterium]|jgi:hypothetical protein|nr:hypothetical protein [Deltaproteobacteria bacterium]